MKLSCDTIRDLLPLYKDNVCSDSSKDLVEEHLTSCEECRTYYEKMEEGLPEITESMPGGNDEDTIQHDLQFLKDVSRKITFRQMLVFGLTVIVLFIIGGSIYWINQLPSDSPIVQQFSILDSRISIDEVTVKEVYELENGDIFCTLETDAPVNIWEQRYASSKQTPSVYTDQGNFNTLTFTTTVWDRLNPFSYDTSLSFTVPMRLLLVGPPDRQEPAKAIYYEGKGGEKLTIWEEGQSLPPAPDAIEKKVAKEWDSYQEDCQKLKDSVETNSLDPDIDQLYIREAEDVYYYPTDGKLLLNPDYTPNFIFQNSFMRPESEFLQFFTGRK